MLVEVGTCLNGAKYELITLLARPMSPICGRALKTKMCTTSLNEAPAASSVSLMPSIVRRVCSSRLGGKYFKMSSRRCGWS